MRHRLLLLAFFLSGFAALGYEILWSQLLALALGVEMLAVIGVLTGYFGGMALGAALLDGRVRRSPNPVRLFIGLELCIALFAVISPYWLHWLARVLPAWLGPRAGDNDSLLALSLAVLAALIVLLPATFCMGATLAALVEAWRRDAPPPGATSPADAGSERGRAVGGLYAANTLGASLGALGAVHLILPRLGMDRAALLLAGVGVLSAICAWPVSRSVAAAAAPAAAAEQEPSLAAPDARLLSILLAITGAVGIGLEVVGARVLAQLLKGTVYTFAHILVIFLAGTAAGAALFAGRGARRAARHPRGTVALLLLGCALSVLTAGWLLAAAPALLTALVPAGATAARQFLGELVLALAAFGLPTLFMGALFSHLVGLLAPRGVGRAYAVNTLGAMSAPFLFGLLGIQALGYTRAFHAAALVYLLCLFAFVLARRLGPRWMIAGAAALFALLGLGAKSLVLVPVEPGWRLVERREGLQGVSQVTERRRAGEATLRRLQLGEYYYMGGGQSYGEQRMGHLPLLLARGADRALFLGIGTGATLGAARAYPLREIDAVELVPEILELMPHFAAINREVYTDRRFVFHAADARRFAAASRDDYPVIVADLFHPGREGMAFLYTREHFRALRARLRPGGLLAQWLPLHEFDSPNLKVVLRSFLAAFDEVHAFLGLYNAKHPNLLLIGRAPAGDGLPLALDLAVLRQDLSPGREAERAFQDARDLMASYLADGPALAAYAGEGPLNTDFRPRVQYDAARIAYELEPSLGARTLADLLAARRPYPDSFLRGEDPESLARFRAETATFAAAVDRFLEAEIEAVLTAEARPTAALVQRYLDAYATEPAFLRARGKLFELAYAQPPRAEGLFEAMLEISPGEPRIYEAYLGFLQQRGGGPRFEALLLEFDTKFPEASARSRAPR